MFSNFKLSKKEKDEVYCYGSVRSKPPKPRAKYQRHDPEGRGGNKKILWLLRALIPRSNKHFSALPSDINRQYL
ncbi:unnamed protein product, partial [Brenthis ino]